MNASRLAQPKNIQIDSNGLRPCRRQLPGNDPEAHLDGFSRMIDLLCRLNREIATTQRHRDNSRRALGPGYDPAHVKETDKLSALETERFYSDPPDGSNLPKPAEKPFLPPDQPTSFLPNRSMRRRRRNRKTSEIKILNFSKSFFRHPSRLRNLPPLPDPGPLLTGPANNGSAARAASGVASIAKEQHEPPNVSLSPSDGERD